MENTTYHFSSLPHSRESALLMTTGGEVDPNLSAGLLLGSLFMGLISYTWAFWSQRSRLQAFTEVIILVFSGQHGSLRGVQNLHNFLLSVLFFDIVNAIAVVVLVIGFLGSFCNSGILCVCAFFAWYMSRCLAVVLHLLNALACLLFLSNPQMGAKLRCIFTLVTLLTIMFLPFYVFYYGNVVAICGHGAITIGLAVTIVAKCTVSTVSPSAAAQKKLLVVVAMLTFLFVFAPSFILQCLVISAFYRGEPTDEYLTMCEKSLYFTSFHLLMDGLLCFIILKMPSEEEEPPLEEQQQQHQGFENNAYSPNVIT